MTPVPLHPSVSSFDRWAARSVTALWWAGGMLCLVVLVGNLLIARDASSRLLVLASGLGLLGAYVLMSRRVATGLLIACVIGTAAAFAGSESAPDTLVTTAASAGGESTPDTLVMTWFVLVVGVGVAAYRAPLRQAPLLAAAALVAAALAGQRLAAGDAVSAVVALMVASASIGGWRRVLQRQRELALTLARDAEREEIARELHDVVAHHVTALVVQAQAGQFAPDLPVARSALAAIEAEGRAAMGAMRTMVASLRGAPAPVASTDLRAELGVLVTSLRAAGVAVQESVDDVPPALAPTILRLTREAFTNVRRHAVGATVVELSVVAQAGGVRWSVADDGRPSGRLSDGGFGLVGLRERVEALGGQFHAGPRPQGWEVRADLPVEGNS